ncbi:MAG TPA: tail fiber domain-containing protein, partial [Longimicrobiaceae bacterium]
ALGTLGLGLIPASGCGFRMMWYPGKAAFRAGSPGACPGTVTQWDDANIGQYSWAGGNGTVASGQSAMAFGDGSRAGGQGSVALGYLVTANNDYSVAIGYRASNNGHTGTFVWGDQSATDSVLNSADNEFRIRAAGGVALRTSSTGSTGCNLPAGSGTFVCSSSRALKEGFRAVDGEEVLRRLRATPVSTWSYISEGPRVRHMGPFAEDFYRAFGLGVGGTGIGLGDIDGVNFAAAQALEARTAALQAELAATRRLVAELQARMARLEQR